MLKLELSSYILEIPYNACMLLLSQLRFTVNFSVMIIASWSVDIWYYWEHNLKL